MIEIDEQTRGLHRSCVQLSGDAVFTPHCEHGDPYYRIELREQMRFFRIDYRSYVFVSLLDGATTFSSALASSARTLGCDALSEREATELVMWLVETGIARLPYGPAREPKNGQARTATLNPLFTKIRLGDPSRILDATLPVARAVAHPGVLAALIGFLAFSVLVLLSNWNAFTADSARVFSPSNWVAMVGVWIGLKVVHEFAHAVVCRHFGGDVHETGLIFVLFAPMAYVDVTSSWRFRSKWQRIAVAVAGVTAELLVAATAIVLWSYTDSATVKTVCQSLVVAATVTTLLFNLNPLMRFDGYFIVTDLLDLPNLYERGSQSLHRDLRWIFLGQTETRKVEEPWTVRCYGVLAAIWKVVICMTMLVGASVMFNGAGLVLAGVGIVLWFGIPMWRTLSHLARCFGERRTSFHRAIAVTAGLIGIGGTLLAYAPNPLALRAPCVIDYHQMAFVRSESDGFIREVRVRNGERVEAGQILVRIDNADLQTEIVALESELAQSTQRSRAARDRHDPSAVQIELQKQFAARRKLADLRSERQSLEIKAPQAGRVIAREIESRNGSFVKKGEPVLLLGNPEQKEVLVSISDDDVAQVIDHVGNSVTVHLSSNQTLRGVLAEIRPRASRELPHEAFAATVGGPLAVQERPDESETPHAAVELVRPRFQAIVRFDATDAAAVFAGQRGWVTFGRRHDSIATSLRQIVDRFIAQTRRSVRAFPANANG